jgi:beta-phosphoglucomutase family hydrolase
MMEISPHRWMPEPGTAALIFDCDGTLADTMPAHYHAWLSMLRPYGIPFPEDRFYAMGGMPTAQIIRILAADAGISLSDSEVDRMVHCKEETFLRHLSEVRRIEPVVQVAARFRGQLPLAVASGGYRHTITRTLGQLQLLDWFDVLVTAEDTPRHKPAPDVFLEAARRLGVPASRCVVFEDTDIGLEAACRAGMTAVDVRPWRDAWRKSVRWC